MADKRKTKPDYCVVVVGAGISGLRTSITLAELGCRVLLADRMPSPGGLLRPIEKQFPSNHCGLCRMLPRIRGDEARAGCLRQGLVHERVMFYPQTEVDTISGEPGDLTVTLTSIPTGVSPELCMACGVCEDVCPAVGPDPFNAGLTTRKAIHPASPFAPSGYRVIDWDVCTRCGECVQACSVGAISLEDKPRTWDTESVALVLTTTGQTLYNPHHVDLYGGGLLPNVVTANAYERLTSSMGPFGGLSPDGLPRRPSDGQEARRIAWVQCVGSRNVTIGADYCSNACCMFAVKEAMMTRERAVSGVDTAIFYMDMRTHARDYQRYRDQAERDGVRFIRSRVHSLDATDNPHQVSIRYLDEDGRPAAEAFDLVVLSTGQAPGETNRLPAYTDHDGVLSAASSQQLMDITEAVTSADALAGEAVARMTVIGFRPQEDPDAHDAPQESPPLDDQPPKTLVAVLTNQKIVVDWAGLERGLPERTQLIRIPAKDRQSQMDAVRQGLKDTASNRLVLLTPGLDPISLAPVTLEHSMGLPDLYIEALDYSPILYRYDDPGGRAASLRLKILGAVARLSLRRAKEPETIQVEPTTLVVGAGPSGLSAALVLSQSGIRVILVDKSDRIGGTASRLVSASGRETVQGLIEAMKKDPLIDIRTGTEAVGFSGASGHYRVTLRQSSGDEETIDAGAVILAPGGGLDRTDHYLFGVHDRVVTIGQWAEELRPDSNKAQDMGDVAVILCAAARQEPHKLLQPRLLSFGPGNGPPPQRVETGMQHHRFLSGCHDLRPVGDAVYGIPARRHPFHPVPTGPAAAGHG